MMADRKGTLRALRTHLVALARPLVLTHLAWTALGFVLLAPLVGGLSRLLLSLSGETAIADQDIARFALTPLGLGSMLLVAAVVVSILALEIASMMRLVAGATHGPPTGTVGALRFAFAHARPIVALALRLLVRVLLLALPFLAAGGAVAWVLLKDHDINYYLAEKPPAYWVALGVVGALAAILGLLLVRKALAWSLALPLVLFARAGSKQALDESEGIAHGKRMRILVALAGWAVPAFLLGLVLLGGVHGLGSWLLPTAGLKLAPTMVILGLLALLLGLGQFLVAGINAASFSLIDYDLYERFGPGVATGVLGEAPPRESRRRWHWTGPRVVMALVLAALAAVLTGGWLLEGVRIVDDVEVIAHRGAAGSAPENTLAAMRRAMEDATDWVELDVQETSDGRVIVIHDSDFMKLAKVDLKVWDATFEQARAIDVGSWFAPSFSAERVPTLEDVLELAKGTCGVVIELKYYGHDQDLERRVVDLVEKTGMVDSIQVMSLDYEGIQKVRALRPTWRIGLLTATAIGDLTRRDADFLAVNAGMATAAFIERAHRQGKDVYAWTINDAVAMSRMITLGIDGLITDEPGLARRVLAERAAMSTAERLLLHAAALFDLDIRTPMSDDAR